MVCRPILLNIINVDTADPVVEITYIQSQIVIIY